MEKKLTVGALVSFLNDRAPVGTAEKWDNTGLLAGDPAWTTKGAVVSIDLTAEAIRVARAKGYRLIVNHHPCLFPKSKGASRVVAGDLVFEAVRHGVAVASSHTDFDQCALEVPRAICAALGATPVGRLLEPGGTSLLKLVVFVPRSHLSAVREAVCAAGAGQIGAYDRCTFGAEGEGTFRGGAGTRPFAGRPGRLETAREVRLETVLPRGLRRPVLQALRAAHPYEEIAYDLYPLEQAPGPLVRGLPRGLGYGFVADFKRARPFAQLARDLRKAFRTEGFWLTEPAPKRVRRIGFVAGKGASFAEAAAQAGCDLFITGETGYHVARQAAQGGLAVLELGHRESEYFYLETMAGWLRERGLKTALLNTKTQRIWG